jgi:hypothetical protein
MLQITGRKTLLGEMFNVQRGDELPFWAVWVMLAAISGICVMLLNKRLRGREVVS